MHISNRTTVTIDKTLYYALRSCCKANGRTVTWGASQAIAEWIERNSLEAQSQPVEVASKSIAAKVKAVCTAANA